MVRLTPAPIPNKPNTLSSKLIPTAVYPPVNTEREDRKNRSKREEEKRGDGRSPGRTPKLFWINAQFFSRQGIKCGIALVHQMGYQFVCGFLIDALRLINQRQLLLFLLRGMLQFLTLDSDLVKVELTRTLH